MGCNGGRILLGFYLFKSFVQVFLEANMETRDASEDFVVIARGEMKITVDMMSGRSVDVRVHSMRA